MNNNVCSRLKHIKPFFYVQNAVKPMISSSGKEFEPLIKVFRVSSPTLAYAENSVVREFLDDN